MARMIIRAVFLHIFPKNANFGLSYHLNVSKIKQLGVVMLLFGNKIGIF